MNSKSPFYRLSFILFLLCCSMVVKAESELFKCPKEEGLQGLQLPIVFRFKGISLQNQDIYKSMGFAVKSNLKGYWVDPKSWFFDKRKGLVTLHFCLKEWASAIALKVGLRNVELHLNAFVAEQINKGVSESNVHPSIVLLDQPAPDWLIPLKYRESQTVDGNYIIDIKLINPSDSDLLGPEVLLIANRRNGSCASPNPTEHIDVNFLVSRGQSIEKGLTVYSNEPSLPEPISRNGTITTGYCGGRYLKTSIGGLGVLKKGEVMKVRYKLHNFESLEMPRLAIKFTGTRIFPQRVPDIDPRFPF